MSNKARTSSRARPIVRAALGGEENDLPGTTAFYLYTPDRADEIILATRFPVALPPDCMRGSRKFLKLRRDLGMAAQALLGPSRDERMQVLQEVEDKCLALRSLLEADHQKWSAWKEIRENCHLASLNISVSPADVGYPVTLPAAITTIGELARQTRQQLATEQSALSDYLGALASAYAEFFGMRAGISTDSEAGKKRGGPFVRFAAAVAKEIGLDLPPEQIRKRLLEWKAKGPKVRD